MRIQRRIPLLFQIFWAAAMVAGCGGSVPAGPSFEVSFESMARSAQAMRVEVYLVDSCDDVTLGARPVPAVATTYVRRDKAGALGEVEPGDYGLYGVAQDVNCGVVAAGCTPVTIAGPDDDLAVTLSNLQSGGCANGTDCSLDTGECIENAGGTGGAGGAGGMGGTPLMRVDAGLIVLYEFDEGSGSTVVDRSGVVPTLDLTIADPGNVTWSSDHLTVNSTTTLSTANAAAKVVTGAQASGELTVEAWVKPASPAQTGPARIISMSLDAYARNFMLGQEANTYAARFRAEGQTDWTNGMPTIFTTSGTATTLLTHVVHTHKSNGSEVLYIDGVQDQTFTRTGALNQWDPTYPIVVANEAIDDRTWLGELHLIAIYDRALEAGEVQQNFTVGP